ncbi:hypothetical protein E2C01_050304 [Portunus trituberculatus]|uniref:Uncharacterized protein n=1 Tax=Portunus trituberculatus TaxID=210409 RepID=A0A5B7GGD5_PORTR|nr:hypothetical protein [Portunus trituberculatus]
MNKCQPCLLPLHLCLSPKHAAATQMGGSAQHLELIKPTLRCSWHNSQGNSISPPEDTTAGTTKQHRSGRPLFLAVLEPMENMNDGP